jgi:hypothetical protein
MWAIVRRQWDFFAIALVLGLYVTGAVALAIILLLTLATNF